MIMEQVMVSAMIFKIQVTRNWQFWFQINKEMHPSLILVSADCALHLKSHLLARVIRYNCSWWTTAVHCMGMVPRFVDPSAP